MSLEIDPIPSLECFIKMKIILIVAKVDVI